ncbi:ARM repeat-containing protein [Gloeophyllum trabeum ATCC 11539]|uniref:ARM repeat-containing protein n=1 Tax=Gloeophyllum trabeum (strain ATCC 11539 / FP-39264 / Madison 617) TaxID=670483 RepID=S7Q5J5_GLOTA|nr:ARM repeat-containing protein [Gloeophyllum trabeum ATCC 11539]EPQ55321.1 ARM repeat-containing protein [Gloeophyllum trabeum ATCC 11539]
MAPLLINSDEDLRQSVLGLAELFSDIAPVGPEQVTLTGQVYDFVLSLLKVGDGQAKTWAVIILPEILEDGKHASSVKRDLEVIVAEIVESGPISRLKRLLDHAILKPKIEGHLQRVLSAIVNNLLDKENDEFREKAQTELDRLIELDVLRRIVIQDGLIQRLDKLLGDEDDVDASIQMSAVTALSCLLSHDDVFNHAHALLGQIVDHLIELILRNDQDAASAAVRAWNKLLEKCEAGIDAREQLRVAVAMENLSRVRNEWAASTYLSTITRSTLIKLWDDYADMSTQSMREVIKGLARDFSGQYGSREREAAQAELASYVNLTPFRQATLDVGLLKELNTLLYTSHDAEVEASAISALSLLLSYEDIFNAAGELLDQIVQHLIKLFMSNDSSAAETAIGGWSKLVKQADENTCKRVLTRQAIETLTKVCNESSPKSVHHMAKRTLDNLKKTYATILSELKDVLDDPVNGFSYPDYLRIVQEASTELSHLVEPGSVHEVELQPELLKELDIVLYASRNGRLEASAALALYGLLSNEDVFNGARALLDQITQHLINLFMSNADDAAEAAILTWCKLVRQSDENTRKTIMTKRALATLRHVHNRPWWWKNVRHTARLTLWYLLKSYPEARLLTDVLEHDEDNELIDSKVQDELQDLSNDEILMQLREEIDKLEDEENRGSSADPADDTGMSSNSDKDNN